MEGGGVLMYGWWGFDSIRSWLSACRAPNGAIPPVGGNMGIWADDGACP